MSARGPTGPLTDRLATAALRASSQARSRWVETSHGPVHALELGGRGRLGPLVLIHGFSSAGGHLFGLARRLRGRFSRVIAPDLPGHGLTPAAHAADRPGRDGHERVAEALDQLVRPHDGPLTVFGSSLGGLVALRYALARPDRVRALIVASPAGAAMDDAALAAFRALFAMRGHADGLAFVARTFAKPPRVARHLLAWGVRRRFGRPYQRALIDSASPADMLDPAELAGLAPPTLCLWGEGDRVMPEGARAFFEEHLPASARVERLAGLGHGPYLERPDVVARRLIAFVEDLRPR